ncbi:hypothetical protein [Mycolicibacterium sp. GESEQ-9]|uniref:hypothetical protein n=1 Tax=Mycolicibacterium sp. GESEQ-9 TaxID=2812656 RepID=UPI001B32F906|nr:hypothetical protein [Mycolicibacterium sp. GESEQ-9]
MMENDGYAVPREPLTDAANDVGRNLDPTTANWLDHVVVGFMHAQGVSQPDATTQGYLLDILTVLRGIETRCAEIVQNTVTAARKEGATWAEIGERLSISKQTAHSRYGSRIEERNGVPVIVDAVLDAVLPLQRIGPNTPPTRAQANPIPPTAHQRQVIADYLAATEAGQPDNLDMTANAVITLARSLADGGGGNWDDPIHADHYLQLALTTFFPNVPSTKQR